jgi:catechol 2,3-dioxygenase-like lactoylglutathione lyase family enzyme
MDATRIDRILEAGLYVADLGRSTRFYTGLFGFDVLLESDRLVALDVGGKSVLLLFQHGQSEQRQDAAGGFIPGHGARGVQHFAFAISPAQIEPWLKRLAEKGIAVESRVTWDGGSQSVYFRDPDNHSLELATPGLWHGTEGVEG